MIKVSALPSIYLFIVALFGCAQHQWINEKYINSAGYETALVVARHHCQSVVNTMVLTPNYIKAGITRMSLVSQHERGSAGSPFVFKEGEGAYTDGFSSRKGLAEKNSKLNSAEQKRVSIFADCMTARGWHLE